MTRMFGRPVSVCGSICKIIYVWIFLAHITAEKTYMSKKIVPRPPDPRSQIFSQFPDSRFFGLQFPDSRFFGRLFPDSRC